MARRVGHTYSNGRGERACPIETQPCPTATSPTMSTMSCRACSNRGCGLVDLRIGPQEAAHHPATPPPWDDREGPQMSASDRHLVRRLNPRERATKQAARTRPAHRASNRPASLPAGVDVGPVLVGGGVVAPVGAGLDAAPVTVMPVWLAAPDPPSVELTGPVLSW